MTDFNPRADRDDAREIAFQKIAARVEGSRMAAEKLVG